MRRYLFLLLILVVLAACSSNKTAETDKQNPCNEIDLEKHLAQLRAEDKQAMDNLQNNMELYRENVFMAVKDLEELRKEVEKLLNDPEFINPDTEVLKKYVEETGKGLAKEMNSIEYREKMEAVKNRIADIEKFMRENCYGFTQE